MENVSLTGIGSLWHITIDDGEQIISSGDRAIARYIEMEVAEYKNKCIREFGAGIKYNKVWFIKKEDGERARQWVESIIIANKLKGA